MNMMEKELFRDFYRENKMFRVAVILIAIIFLSIISFNFICTFNDTEYTITVTGKERIVEDFSSKYLVFSEDTHGNVLVFENTDSLLRWKWDSSNIQGQLKEGNTYKIVVVGFRVPFLSMYQNIIKVEEVQ